MEERSLIDLEVVDGGDGERRYGSRWPLIDTPTWNSYGLAEREQISAEIGVQIQKEVEAAAAAGTFDARTDRFLVRLPVWLDERGWRELSEALEESLESCLAVQQRAHARLRESGGADEGSPGRVLLVSFEAPPASPRE